MIRCGERPGRLFPRGAFLLKTTLIGERTPESVHRVEPARVWWDKGCGR